MVVSVKVEGFEAATEDDPEQKEFSTLWWLICAQKNRRVWCTPLLPKEWERKTTSNEAGTRTEEVKGSLIYTFSGPIVKIKNNGQSLPWEFKGVVGNYTLKVPGK